MCKLVIVLLATLSIPVLGIPDTIYVPDDYSTIQQAIYRSTNGDTIIVKPGTYVEVIEFMGKSIVVKSEQGPEVTFIDGGQNYRVVVFWKGEGPDTVIEGFTITNGGDHGMDIIGSSPTVRNCIISYNSADDGGGMNNYNSSPTVTHCVFHHNHADDNGGGMFNTGSSGPVVTDCLFVNNSGNYGGGIYNDDDSQSTVTGCVFHDNSAGWGGGMLLSGENNIVANCLFSENWGASGGGIGVLRYNATIMNCTFYGNEAQWGGGLRMFGEDLTLINSIFWNNDAPEGPEFYIGFYAYPCTLNISYSNVEGGSSSAHVLSGCKINWGSGMIDADPLFCDAAGGDLHLTYTSPCRDTGSSSTAGLPDIDFEGDPRIAWGGTVDMGADEFYNHFYIMGDRTPGGTIEGKFVGLPGTNPVGLFMGSGVLSAPANTMWGEFWLESPWFLIPLLYAPAGIPGDGIFVLPTTIPVSPSAPYDVATQALIGLNPDSLTNLELLEVR